MAGSYVVNAIGSESLPPVSAEGAEIVRGQYMSPFWSLDGTIEEVKPPATLWTCKGEVPNPVGDLGMCGCPARHARPCFVEFCLEHIRNFFRPYLKALVYVTLGSGKLYHDWEVIEELLNEGFKISEVHVVDRQYKTSLREAEASNNSIGRALKALGAWLEMERVTLIAHEKIEDLVEWAGSVAKILMQCDAHCPDDRLAPAMVPGGLHLHMTFATGEWLEAWHKPLNPTEVKNHDKVEETSHHAIVEGLVLHERRSGFDARSGEVLSRRERCARSWQRERARRRRQALHDGTLFRVVGEQFPESWLLGRIGVCVDPREGSGITELYSKGDELVVDPSTSTPDGWVRMSRRQLDRPTGRTPGWVLVGDISTGHHGGAESSKLLENVTAPTHEATAITHSEVDAKVDVTVTHAVQLDQQVLVTVPRTATMLDVRQAVAIKLGRFEILSKGRLAYQAADNFLTFRDSEELGSRESVCLLGVDDLEPAAAVAARHLDRDQVFELVKELYDGFADDDFQRKWKALHLMHRERVRLAGAGNRDLLKVSREFFKNSLDLSFTVHREVLLKYGFKDTTTNGISPMMKLLGQFALEDAEIALLLVAVNGLVGMAPTQKKVSAVESYSDGELAEVMIPLGRQHAGTWLRCRVTRPCEIVDTYDVYVLPTPLAEATGLSGTCLFNVSAALLRKITMSAVSTRLTVARCGTSSVTKDV